MNNRLYVSFLAVLASAALASCDGATEVSEIVDVTVEVDQPFVAKNKPVGVTVTVTNRGRRTVTVTSKGCPSPFDITDSSGSRVGPAPQLCTLELVLTRLAPTENLSFTRLWDGDGLPIGEYRILGRVTTTEGVVRGAAEDLTVVGDSNES